VYTGGGFLGACERWTGCVVTVAYFDASGVIIWAASLSSFFFFENRDGMLLFYNIALWLLALNNRELR
jgi:hypothetical protein